jgi:hypothetical protein
MGAHGLRRVVGQACDHRLLDVVGVVGVQHVPQRRRLIALVHDLNQITRIVFYLNCSNITVAMRRRFAVISSKDIESDALRYCYSC